MIGPRVYFGKVYFLLFYEQNGIRRLLALVALYRPSVDTLTGSIYVTSSQKDPLFILDAMDIQDFVGLLLMSERQRFYLIWPGMQTNDANGLTIGDINDI